LSNQTEWQIKYFTGRDIHLNITERIPT